MTKGRLIFIAAWGNIMGFFTMRILGKSNDYTPSFKQGGLDDLFAIVIFVVVLSCPGVYFYAIGKKSSDNDTTELFEQISITFALAFFLGLIGIILGRTF